MNETARNETEDNLVYARIDTTGKIEIADSVIYTELEGLPSDKDKEMRDLGYKPIIYSPKPDKRLYKRYDLKYENSGDEIQASYRETITPTDQVRRDRHMRIKDSRDRLESEPLIFHGEKLDVDLIAARRLMIASIGLGEEDRAIPWTVHEDGKQPIQLFPNDFKEIFRLLEARGTEIHVRYRKLKEILYTSQDWDEVANLSWDTMLEDEDTQNNP